MRYGLSLSPDDWHGLAAWASNHRLAWKRVKLRPLDADSVPKSSGVYVMTPHAFEGVWDKFTFLAPTYVGKAVNLQGRFKQHASGSKEATRVTACFGKDIDFWFAETPAYAELEALLIGCLGPAANLREERTIRVRVLTPQPAGKAK